MGYLVFLCGKCLDNALHQLVNVAVASGSISALQLEQAKALQQTGWWPSNSNISSACDWNGITCNAGGSVTNIVRFNRSLKDLSVNNLTGSNLYHEHNLHWVTYVNLSHNFLSEEIPVALGSIALVRHLRSLDLSFNNFTGNIPSSLIEIHALNLSHNSLKGQIPDGFDKHHKSYTLIGNRDLCGQFKIFPPCPKSKKSIATKIEIFAPITTFLIFLVIGGILLSRCVFKENQLELRESKNGNIFSIWNYDRHIAYEDIIEATEDFDIKYYIGTGGYGSVYKAKLPSGNVVALKKLHQREAENPIFFRSFMNEVRVLTKIRYRNIVKLRGFCVHKGCKF
ncbi:MDIS1-interacting receptor like kinase 2-like [Carya illinoinensis]|uniref:MDIS1-interacting receptor like kinase 2-like n=1 Tax=Carya illinoinensis TaxID=32201 RepID=UPI001C71DEFA|nr:MDIS1-interacting receptor like kinase 2-like [Carya illinoinensis]